MTISRMTLGIVAFMIQKSESLCKNCKNLTETFCSVLFNWMWLYHENAISLLRFWIHSIEPNFSSTNKVTIKAIKSLKTDLFFGKNQILLTPIVAKNDTCNFVFSNLRGLVLVFTTWKIRCHLFEVIIRSYVV
jgi:hypothetical protein